MLFDRFCDGVFAHPWLSSAATTKILTVELGTGYEAGRFAARFLRRPRAYCIREHRSSADYGWRTTKISKNQYTQQLWMKMAEGAIYYLDDMVCANPWLDETSRRERTVKEFEEQVSRFQTIHKTSANPFAEPSVTTSGKVGHDGTIQQGVNDDMAMSVAMNLYITLRVQTRSIPTINYARLLGDGTAYRGLKRRRDDMGTDGRRGDIEKRQRRHVDADSASHQ